MITDLSVTISRPELAPLPISGNQPELLPLSTLGPRQLRKELYRFGVLFPGVSPEDKNTLTLKIIHEKDQFLQEIQPNEFAMTHSMDPVYGDLWSCDVMFDPSKKNHKDSAWGLPGKYVYRFQLMNSRLDKPVDWIIDPFAREYGIGKLSALTYGYQDYEWSAEETLWKTPPLQKLVIYELMLNEFGGGVEGTIALIPYLQDLGVNCLEIMPVSNVALTLDWGYLPNGYFGVDERFGNRRNMQLLIDEAHQHGMAVILDSVYGHTSSDFPYAYLYRHLPYPDPMMGPFAKDMFGRSTDFNKKFTRDFFFTVNHHWLDCYDIDGFRYDCVPNYWDGAVGNGYANLVYHTYEHVKASLGVPYWKRFERNGSINLIQCAEQLEAPVEVLEKSYSNCGWQNQTFGSAEAVARGDRGQIANFGMNLGLSGFPEEITCNGESIPKSALQYIENHDHSRFLCNFGTNTNESELVREGNRDRWFKEQPYLIALLASKGIPMLWEGEEIGENYWVPENGMGRVAMFRPVRWDYFYDQAGKSLISLVRKLVDLRNRSPQFQAGSHFFYNHWERYQSKNLLLFSRFDQNAFSLVALNFGDCEQWAPFWFPISGIYHEELHGEENLCNVGAYQEYWLKIPSNYGRIWTCR